MPKIVQNPKTRAEIQKESNERRGIVNKAFKLHQDTVTLIKELAQVHQIPQNQLITEAVKLWQAKNQA